MPRTKHAYIVIFVVLAFLAGVLVTVLLLRPSVPEFVQSSDARFSNGENEYGATLAEDSTRESSRLSLIEKLLGRSPDEYQVTQEVQDEDVVDEEGVEEDEADDENESDESDATERGVLLGDGRISTSPKNGYIYSCQQNFNGGGAHADGDWIVGEYWNPDGKVTVNGSVSWGGEVSIEQVEGARVITSNGLPNHGTGMFPIQLVDDAYQYDRNPNKIAAQNTRLELPLTPALASAPTCLSLGMIGVGLNGVAIFNGLDGMGRDAAAHEIQDSCGGHPERSGEYHYHDESDCLVSSYYEGAVSTLVGYALDGFGIFSSIEGTKEITNSDLDSCHGHTHEIPWDGVMSNLYHYHMTNEYPFSLGCFMGTPTEVTDASSASSLPPPPPGGGLPPPRPQ